MLTPKKSHAWMTRRLPVLIAGLFTMILALSVVAGWVSASPLLQSTPVPRPTPDLNPDYQPKMAVIELTLTPTSAALNNGYIIRAFSSGWQNGAPQLEIQLLDHVGDIVRQYNMNNPLWQDRRNPDGTRTLIQVNSIDAAINFTFEPIMKTMRLTDVASGVRLLDVDLEIIFQRYCLENPSDLDCVADLVPYLFHSGWEIDNPSLTSSRNRVTVDVVVENLGGNPSEVGIPVLVTINSLRFPSRVLVSQRFILNSALVPGQEVTTRVVLIVTGLSDGTYWLTASVDPEGVYREISHENNIIRAQVRIHKP